MAKISEYTICTDKWSKGALLMIDGHRMEKKFAKWEVTWEIDATKGEGNEGGGGDASCEDVRAGIWEEHCESGRSSESNGTKAHDENGEDVRKLSVNEILSSLKRTWLEI